MGVGGVVVSGTGLICGSAYFQNRKQVSPSSIRGEQISSSLSFGASFS